jgi:hypothetical protein
MIRSGRAAAPWTAFKMLDRPAGLAIFKPPRSPGRNQRRSSCPSGAALTGSPSRRVTRNACMSTAESLTADEVPAVGIHPTRWMAMHPGARDRRVPVPRPRSESAPP